MGAMMYAHEVCFSCRKSWAPRVERGRVLVWSDDRVCPDCGKPLLGLGLRFKPPKRQNVREWRRLEALAVAGEKFVKW